MKKILSTALLFLLVTMKAQVPITLYDQFLGKYDFTMIGNTMNFEANAPGNTCAILTQSSATLNLTAGQTVEAAYLYWAGSGSLTVGDLDIKLNGIKVNVNRTFQADIIFAGFSRPFYSGFSDVTAQVQATGNGIYTVSDFDLNDVIPPYCQFGTSGGLNFGGWSILIVYEDSSLTNNLVNIYDGFEKVDGGNQSIDIQLQNLNILQLTGNKIGFLAWEGDINNPNNEQLIINDNLVSNPPLNPGNNVFNCTNSFTGSDELWNMDMDYFDINSYTNLGDQFLTVKLNSNQDVVAINNIVLTLNSEVPDATIDFETNTLACDIRDIEVNYTIHNTIATDILPANTPIAFYADGTLVGTAATLNDIPIGGSEPGNITLTIPNTVPNNFSLEVKVDDDGLGNSTVIEFLETNNTYQEQILLGTTPTLLPADNLILCDLNDNGSESFDLTVPGNQILGVQPGVTIRYYEDQTDADAGNGDFITTPNNYTNTAGNQTIFVRLEDPAGCFAVTSFTIEIIAPAAIAHTIPDMESCIDGPATTGISTNLTTQDTFVLNGNNASDYTISYHTTEASARQGTVTIPNPNAFPNASNPQVIWVRMVSDEHCVEIGSFNLIYNLNPVVQNGNLENCSFTGIATYHLPDVIDQIVTDPTDLIFTFHLTNQEATDGDGDLPEDYTNNSPNQVIFVRIETSEGCFSVAELELTTIILHEELSNTFEQCDDPTQINDGKSTFDLTQMDSPVENALGGSGFTISYHLTMSDAQNGTAPISNATEYENTTNPQTIYARASGGDGSCGGTAEFVLEVLPVPEFELPAFIAFCEDEQAEYQFDNGFATYLWKDSDGNIIGNSATVEFQEEGMHTLEVTSNENDCPAIRDVEVIFDSAPVITSIEVDGETVSVFPTGGESPYQYSYNEGLTWHDYFILTDVPPGVHSMWVKSKYGCISEAKLFGVLGIPNVITPNGDGYNDYWELRALEMYPDAYIKIFDRYGKIFVDRKIDGTFRWDGRYLGRPIASGDYWYIITVEKDKSITGHISVRNQ